MPKAIESLATALEREHREIDEGVEAFVAGTRTGVRDRTSLTRAMHALRRHIYLEEEFLFPPLRAAGMVAPLFVMLREHAQIWTTLESLERELAADATDDSLMLCHQLAVQLQHHNSKEERIVYPQADQVLTAPASEQLRKFLDSGELPEGWVCEKLRPRS